jgi:membrane protein DedA with SNARE-associated domain
MLSLPVVIAVAAGTAIAGDTVGYWLGRRRGRAFLMRDGFLADHRRDAVQRADRYFARHGTATVFFGRWVPGVRVIAAVMAGATRMPWKHFAVANALGAITWATTVATASVLLGPAVTAMVGLASLAAAVGSVGVAWWRRRRRRAPLAATP